MLVLMYVQPRASQLFQLCQSRGICVGVRICSCSLRVLQGVLLFQPCFVLALLLAAFLAYSVPQCVSPVTAGGCGLLEGRCLYLSCCFGVEHCGTLQPPSAATAAGGWARRPEPVSWNAPSILTSALYGCFLPAFDACVWV
jgi:hypothetical protein